MRVKVFSYTIYHSPNAYLGTVLLRRALSDIPNIDLIRRPIFVPRERGVLIAEMLQGKENVNAGSYNREDCRRWAQRFSIPFIYPEPEVFRMRAERWAHSSFHREELPARAYYAADANIRDVLDQYLFEAAWVEGLDVNEPDTVRWAAARAHIDGNNLLATASSDAPGAEAREALSEFDRWKCPGVPTVIVSGERFFGKDRVDWVRSRCSDLLREC